MFWSKPFIVVSINISRFINSTLTPSITVIWAWNQHGCVIWQPFQKLSKFTDRKIMVSHSSPCEDRTHLVLLVRQVQSPDCEGAFQELDIPDCGAHSHVGVVSRETNSKVRTMRFELIPLHSKWKTLPGYAMSCWMFSKGVEPLLGGEVSPVLSVRRQEHNIVSPIRQAYLCGYQQAFTQRFPSFSRTVSYLDFTPNFGRFPSLSG